MSDDGHDPTSGILLMVDQMKAAYVARLHFPALITALTLPDICGALGSESGRSSGPKTRQWIADWLPSSGKNAAGIYGLRCSLLHQGSTYPDDGSPRVVFNWGHGSRIEIHGPATTLVAPTGEEMTPIGIGAFVGEVSRGVAQWLEAHSSSATVRRNLLRFAHLRTDGFPPFLAGGQFIA